MGTVRWFFTPRWKRQTPPFITFPLSIGLHKVPVLLRHQHPPRDIQLLRSSSRGMGSFPSPKVTDCRLGLLFFPLCTNRSVTKISPPRPTRATKQAKRFPSHITKHPRILRAHRGGVQFPKSPRCDLGAGCAKMTNGFTKTHRHRWHCGSEKKILRQKSKNIFLYYYSNRMQFLKFFISI